MTVFPFNQLNVPFDDSTWFYYADNYINSWGFIMVSQYKGDKLIGWWRCKKSKWEPHGSEGL